MDKAMTSRVIGGNPAASSDHLVIIKSCKGKFRPHLQVSAEISFSDCFDSEVIHIYFMYVIIDFPCVYIYIYIQPIEKKKKTTMISHVWIAEMKTIGCISSWLERCKGN